MGCDGTACAPKSMSQLSEVPLVLFAMHIGPCLAARELPVLCAAQPLLWDSLALFAGWLAVLQHGREAASVDRIKQLIELERMPKACLFDFSAPEFLKESQVQLIRGSQLAYPIFVGSTHYALTTAVNPPARGDAWSVSVELQKGRYRATVVAWRNPFHGILDLWLGDRLVSGAGGLDCYSTATAERHTFPALEVEIPTTGWHTWTFEVSRSQQPERYWMCMEEFRVEPVGAPERPAAPQPPRRPRAAWRCPRR